MATQKKPWYASKTKWASIVGALLLFANEMPAWLAGGAFPAEKLLLAIGVLLAIFGLRDLPVVNRT